MPNTYKIELDGQEASVRAESALEALLIGMREYHSRVLIMGPITEEEARDDLLLTAAGLDEEPLVKTGENGFILSN